MSNYDQYCPVAKALDILGDRWTLLIVRNMLCGMTHFNDLERGLPGISRGVLAQRLRRLQKAGVIDKRTRPSARKATEYHLTQSGWELGNVVAALIIWGESWVLGEPKSEEVDALLLMWLIRADVLIDRLPNPLTVVQFNFYGLQVVSYWLFMTTADVSLCVTDPGYGIDLVVTADLTTYYKLWYGRLTFRQAVHDYGVRIEGIPSLVRAFPDLFAWRVARGIETAQALRKAQSQDQRVEDAVIPAAN